MGGGVPARHLSYAALGVYQVRPESWAGLMFGIAWLALLAGPLPVFPKPVTNITKTAEIRVACDHFPTRVCRAH